MRRRLPRQLRRMRSRLTPRLTMRVGSTRLVFDTRDPTAKRWFFPRYLDGQPHEPGVSDIFLACVGPDETVLDVGANLGYFTVLAAQLAPHGCVHGIEVDPNLVRLTARSLALNPGNARTTLTTAAAAARDGDLVTFSPVQPGNPSTNTIATVGRQGSTLCSPTVTVDAYCRGAGIVPTVIKMDIEGAEAQAIHGMTETLQRYPTVLLEVHPAAIRAAGGEPDDILATIRAAAPAYRIREIAHRVSGGSAEPSAFDSQRLREDEPVMLFLTHA